MTLKNHIKIYNKLVLILTGMVVMNIAYFFSSIPPIIGVIIFGLTGITFFSILIYKEYIKIVFGKKARRFFYKTTKESPETSGTGSLIESNYTNKSIVTDPSNSHIAGNIYYHGI